MLAVQYFLTHLQHKLARRSCSGRVRLLLLRSRQRSLGASLPLRKMAGLRLTPLELALCAVRASAGVQHCPLCPFCPLQQPACTYLWWRSVLSCFVCSLIMAAKQSQIVTQHHTCNLWQAAGSALAILPEVKASTQMHSVSG